MKSLEPIVSAALSLYGSKGAYALLLRSGVSRSAQIPTGWEVTESLIRRIALAQGADEPKDPAAWYLEQFGERAEYTRLLELTGSTPASRLQILRGFFEPKEGEEARRPTDAHRAIADLVAKGYIRVIITTNFDRLIETALRDAGIEPQVISGDDDASGALPLVHAPCTVIKVHGDYMDTRIRNTAGEVQELDSAVNTLLDRVFDEFGVIVCGWSAEWDTALRAAVKRSPSRRFPWYWAARREPEGLGADLVAHRDATWIPIEDADSFFSRLRDHVVAVEGSARPHPISIDLAIEMMKTYLMATAPRIDASDLLRDAAQEARESVRSAGFTDREKMEAEDGAKRILAWDESLDYLLHLLSVTAYWCDRDLHRDLVRVIETLDFRPSHGGGTFYPATRELLRYPAMVALYVSGIAAVLREDYELLATLLWKPRLEEESGEIVAPAQRLLIGGYLKEYSQGTRPTLKGQTWKWPTSDHLREILPPVMAVVENDPTRIAAAFDEFEYLLSLAYWLDRGGGWAPVASWAIERYSKSEFLKSIERRVADGESWPPYAAGVLGTRSWPDVETAVAEFNAFAVKQADAH